VTKAVATSPAGTAQQQAASETLPPSPSSATLAFVSAAELEVICGLYGRFFQETTLRVCSSEAIVSQAPRPVALARRSRPITDLCLEIRNKDWRCVLGTITATQYISLDGVVEDPVGMEDSGLGNWTGPFTRGPEGDKFKDDELRDAAAILLATRRRNYTGVALRFRNFMQQESRRRPCPNFA